MKTKLLCALLSAGVIGSCGHADGVTAPRSQGPAATQQSGQQVGKIERPLVELFSWWTAPGEAEALQTLIDAHTARHPEARMFNAAAASGKMAKVVLAERLSRHEPPDMLQDGAHDLRAVIAKEPNTFDHLDSLFDELGLRKVLFPEVVEVVSHDGHVWAIPVNMHRENGVFYNKQLFVQHHLTPPRTLPEFLQVCKQLKAAGVTPIATAQQGWILRIMFNTLAMAKMGPETYHQLYTGKTTDLAPLLAAVDLFDQVMTDYVNPDAGEEGFGWTNAAQAVFRGDAAMFLHGDWATGYFMQLGWKPGDDFGVLDAPSASELFLYGVDVFALPKGGTNNEGGREFLKTVVSVPAQAAFNKAKGSSPVRTDVPKSLLNPVGQDTMASLERAKIRMLVRAQPEWEQALVKFAKDRDRDALLQVFRDHLPH